MHDTFWWVVLVILGYGLGSIPTGKLLVWRLKHVDIQKIGSGNIGMTNVKRVLGLSGALVVFTLDAVKAFIPLYLTLLILPFWPAGVTVGIATVLGNLYPVWLRFRGG